MKKRGTYILLFIFFFILSLYFQRRKDRIMYQTFLSADIDGVLEDDVWADSGGNRIKVQGMIYEVKIIRPLKGEYITFSKFAKAGDYIRKVRESDTILLQKANGKKYFFGFKKYK